jgi:hypothetical protein
VFLLNSRSHLFSATPSAFEREALQPTGAPLIPKLRCQFAEFLNHGSLEHLRILSSPTCVGLRYGLRTFSHTRVFLAACLGSVVALAGALFASRFEEADLPTSPTYLLKPAIPTAGRPFTPASPLMVKRMHTGTGILNLFPITYASRPRLRIRLTLSRLTLLRNPWVYGDTVFHSVYRYLCQHFLFCTLQHALRRAFRPEGLPLRGSQTECSPTAPLLEPTASVIRLVPRIIDAESLD